MRSQSIFSPEKPNMLADHFFQAHHCILHNRDQIFKTEISESISKFQLTISFCRIQSTQNLFTHPHNHPDLRKNLTHPFYHTKRRHDVDHDVFKQEIGKYWLNLTHGSKKYALEISTFLSPIVNYCFLNTHFSIKPISASMIPIVKKKWKFSLSR